MRLAELALVLLLADCSRAVPAPAFVSIYRWQVARGCEPDFVRAWQAEAERYRDRYGSRGSRMHRAEDGTFVATAFWASKEAWAAAPRPLDLPSAEAVLNRCIEARVSELHLDVVDDIEAR